MSVQQALSRSVIFGDLPAPQLDLLSRLMVERAVRKGEVLVREGERVHPVGDALFLVVEGHVDVMRADRAHRGEGPLSVLGPGDVFGVASLIDDSPRAASCIAADRGTIACLARRTLDALVHSDLELAARVEHALARQLARDLRVFDRRLQRANAQRS